MNPKLAKKARLRFDRHSGKHMLMYPERGLALNESAKLIVERCDGTRSVEQIVQELDAIAGQSVQADVLAVLEDLQKKGLLEP
ncbi:MAG: pyrroloquinoline quinone biosynthesis peptide chaperone PqqD [Labilithrix sp.]|nr:pyrroloquinoline quinone biosynthesis peptide chaperone PqqD [Labilithrix sp.]MCW5817753.1 pyrroloquinoline quinone biosynthesis peptide chaperone PqqD [Labilithrix sp.]